MYKCMYITHQVHTTLPNKLDSVYLVVYSYHQLLQQDIVQTTLETDANKLRQPRTLNVKIFTINCDKRLTIFTINYTMVKSTYSFYIASLPQPNK